MPEMDGIEATAAIRLLEGPKKNIPVIALTANAISGMKEMFLDKGFNDFLSKPIEIAKLDEMMTKWIPKAKQIKTGAETVRMFFKGDGGIHIPGVDTAKGITMTGGTLDGYKKVLTSFHKDAFDRLPYLAAVPPDNELPGFITHVHALKSAAGTIGAAELSREAAELEAAGKAGDVKVIKEKLSGFYEHLKKTIEDIQIFTTVDATETAEDNKPALSASDAEVRILFVELKAALEAKDMESIDHVTEELAHKNLSKETKETLDAVLELLLVGKFKAAIIKIDTVLKE